MISKRLQTLKQRRPINSFDIVIFFRQFATLITAGIPLLKACDLLEKSQEKPTMRSLIFALKREVLTGQHLYQSLKRHPQHFSEFIWRLVQIGEHTGKLDIILLKIADHLEKHQQIKKDLKQALFYPCLIAGMGIIVTLGMLLFVVPRFAELFSEMTDHLPILTRWIFNLSAIMRSTSTWIVVSSVLLASWHIIKTLTKSPPPLRGRVREGGFAKQTQSNLQKLPVIRHILHKLLLVRFTRNLAITLEAGIPLPDALQLAKQSCNNTPFTSLITQVKSHVNSGQQLHHALANHPCFPTLMIQMIKTGEEAGMLEPMLNKIADFLEADLQRLFTQLHQCLEPLILVMLGVLIGGLVIGMYLPIFKLGSVL